MKVASTGAMTVGRKAWSWAGMLAFWWVVQWVYWRVDPRVATMERYSVEHSAQWRAGCLEDRSAARWDSGLAEQTGYSMVAHWAELSAYY